jgi:hypothetical protein
LIEDGGALARDLWKHVAHFCSYNWPVFAAALTATRGIGLNDAGSICPYLIGLDLGLIYYVVGLYSYSQLFYRQRN